MSNNRYRRVKNAAGVWGWAKLVPFQYTTSIPVTALADGSTANGQINIDPGLPFLCYELGFSTDADTATTTNCPQYLASIVDGNSQQLFSNGSVPRERMFGTRDFPRQLPAEVEIMAATQLTLTFTNKTGGAVTTVLRPVLTGYKLVGWTQAQPE